MTNSLYRNIILILSWVLILESSNLLSSNGQVDALDINGIQFKEGKRKLHR